MENASYHSGRYTPHLLVLVVASFVTVFTACLPSPGKWAELVGMLSIAIALGQVLEMVVIKQYWPLWDRVQRCAFISGFMLGWLLSVAGYTSVIDYMTQPFSSSVLVVGMVFAIFTLSATFGLVDGAREDLSITKLHLSTLWLSMTGVYFSKPALAELRAWVASL